MTHIHKMTNSQKMGTAERKEREKEQRRETIIEAAEAVMEERGLDQFTMDEVAEKAEVSKGALYLHFKNKTALILSVCLKGSSLLNSKMSKILTQDCTGLDMIRLIGETYLHFVSEHRVYFNAFIHYENIQDKDFLDNSLYANQCEDSTRQAMTYVTRALQIGMQDGSINSSYNPKELAVMIWASSRGIVQLAHFQGVGHHFKVIEELEINIESVFQNFIKLLGAGMAAR